MPDRPTVVVCEDRPELAQLVALWLDGDGLETVAVVDSGSAAVDACARRQPDLIILDNWLSGETGLEVVPDLRHVAPDARIVLWTADDNAERDAAGVDVCLSKDDFDALDRVATAVAHGGMHGPRSGPSGRG